MSRTLKKALLVISVLLLGIEVNLYTKEEFTLEKKKELSIQDKYTIIKKFAKQLEQDSVISVKSEQFAGFMLCVFYAESNLKTTSEWNGQQGINQLTKETRKKLNLPEDIRDCSFIEQLTFFRKYLIATNQGHKIKKVYDLHILNFSPYKIGSNYICQANPEKSLHYLDLDKDGDITTNDMKLFIEKRVSENKFVNSIYLSL